jgi:ABC-2 type transport system permease protein
MSLDLRNIQTLAVRTFRQSIESPMAYIVAFFFYGFVGAIFGGQVLTQGNASIDGLSYLAPWALWFVVPALTMSLISEELRAGTFEHLSTLPLRDWEIVLGKYLGFALLIFLIICGLLFYPLFISVLANHPAGLDWGGTIGVLASLFLLSLFYGAIGLFTSSLVKNQVVALIAGMIFCTFFFFVGQLASMLPLGLTGLAEWLGINSHIETLSRGVWDLRDLFYFFSMTGLFLYFAALRLSTRRF